MRSTGHPAPQQAHQPTSGDIDDEHPTPALGQQGGVDHLPGQLVLGACEDEDVGLSGKAAQVAPGASVVQQVLGRVAALPGAAPYCPQLCTKGLQPAEGACDNVTELGPVASACSSTSTRYARLTLFTQAIALSPLMGAVK